MRIPALSLALALALVAGAAVAAPASVNVAIGSKLQDKAVKTYGVDEVGRLADTLRTQVGRELTRTGLHDGARVELTLVDAVPNRPTFKELGDRIGLSLASFGVGGARIEGQVIDADGAVTPVAFKFYETDIDQSWAKATWTDAERGFDRFARQLSRGQTLAMN